MRKLNILKTIIQYLWIISMPIVLILFIAIFGIYFIDDPEIFKTFGKEIDAKPEFVIYGKLLLSLSFIGYLISYFSIYYFKKILEDFSRMKIFTANIVNYFSKIGNLLVIASVILIISDFSFKLTTESKFELNFGISPKITMLCFGLFCMVLSEIFRISMNLKNENDLTV